MMKQINNIILIAVFILLIAAVVLPFAAELQYKQAKRLEGNYRWEKAEQMYEQVIRLDHLNAKYFSEYGDFLMRQGQYHKDKTQWLRRAKGLHKQACRLNPGYGEYRFLLGEVKLQLDDSGGLRDFRKAIQLDPYNLRMNYLIGLSLVSVWKTLDEEGRNFATDRLNYVLQLKAGYAEYFYRAIMDYTESFSIAEEVTPETLIGYEGLYCFVRENNLWQFRKQAREKLDFYRQKETPEKFEQERLAGIEKIKELKKAKTASDLILPEDWQGRSKEGNIYKDGNMYWEGTVDALVNMPEGKSTIYIRAKGSPANGIFPYMIIELDGEEIGEAFVNSTDWKEYVFQVNTGGVIKVLSVTFVNDGGNKEKGEDRNLYVGDVRVE